MLKIGFVFFLILWFVDGVRLLRRRCCKSYHFGSLYQSSTDSENFGAPLAKKIILEVRTTKTHSMNSKRTDSLSRKIGDEADIIGFHSVYKDEETATVVDSPLSKVVDVVFNPLSLIVSLYVVILGYGKATQFLPKFLNFIGWNKKSAASASNSETPDLPYQIFECEICQMQMRPAKGRADKIFSRERFRCARCGAKATSYFNIDDLSDPRAAGRLERLAREAEEDTAAEEDSDSNDFDEA
mmetsp:Transcript_28223/g.38851  ORF Transcript_28223/g.38851 Transcript_28223/m.38851 type:complete len:241 (+) Transcript_28223:3-725(+)